MLVHDDGSRGFLPVLGCGESVLIFSELVAGGGSCGVVLAGVGGGPALVHGGGPRDVELLPGCWGSVLSELVVGGGSCGAVLSGDGGGPALAHGGGPRDVKLLPGC